MGQVCHCDYNMLVLRLTRGDGIDYVLRVGFNFLFFFFLVMLLQNRFAGCFNVVFLVFTMVELFFI